MTAVSSCPRCRTPKASEHFACAPCWREVPREVQGEIYSAYRRHGALSPEWCEAVAKAFAAWGMDVPEWAKVEAEEREA